MFYITFRLQGKGSADLFLKRPLWNVCGNDMGSSPTKFENDVKRSKSISLLHTITASMVDKTQIIAHPRTNTHTKMMATFHTYPCSSLDTNACSANWLALCLDLIGLSSVLRPRQHSIGCIGYMGDGFYRSKDPTNSIKVLKEQIVHRQIKHTISRHEHKTQQVP